MVTDTELSSRDTAPRAQSVSKASLTTTRKPPAAPSSPPARLGSSDAADAAAAAADAAPAGPEGGAPPAPPPPVALEAQPQAQAPPAAPDPSRTRSLVVVMHGKRADDPLLRDAIRSLREEGHQIAVRCTFDAGDADAFVAEALRLNDFAGRRALTIVAAGGDGTVNEVVAALLHHGAPRGVALAILPLGTANDLATALGVSLDPTAALRVALDPTAPRPIDVGLVNGHPFVNVALAGGVSAVPQEELSSPLKRALGPLGIALHVLKRLLFQGVPPTPGVVIRYPLSPNVPSPRFSPNLPRSGSNGSSRGLASDTGAVGSGSGSSGGGNSSGAAGGSAAPADSGTGGVAALEGDLLLLAAGNARQMGRAVSVCPDALLDDGLLDFTFAMGRLTERAAQVLAEAPARGFWGASGGVRHVAAPWLELSASDGGTLIPVNRDGEPEDAATRLLFEVLPQRLLVHMPDTRLLVNAGQTSPPAAAADAENAPPPPCRKPPPPPGRVRRAALRRLLRAKQPEGGAARARQQLRGLAGTAARAAAVLAAGAAAGALLMQRRGGGGSSSQSVPAAGQPRQRVAAAGKGGGGDGATAERPAGSWLRALAVGSWGGEQ